MFDDNGEPYRRRVTDRGGEDDYAGPYRRRQGDSNWIKLLPVASGLMVILIGWGVSVESRIGTMAAVQTERAPIITRHSQQISQLFDLEKDPSPKPEAKIILDKLEAEHTQMDNRVLRLEERFNNFHQFILQVMPKQMVVPPSKRGSMPFTLEGERG